MKITTPLVASAVAASLALIAAIPAAAQDREPALATEQDMHSNNYVDANPNAAIEMLKLPMDEEFHLLNMMRFKDKAEYPKGSEFADKGWTGAQAIAEFRRNAGSIVEQVGGHTHYTGMPQLTLIGPEGEEWDSIFIISYPNVAAFQALLADPEYQKHFLHRKAGTADSRLIRMVPAAASD